MPPLRCKYANSCDLNYAVWITLIKLTALFVMWITTMITTFGCRVNLRVTLVMEDGHAHLRVRMSQSSSLVPERHKHAPGLPKRFGCLSATTISSHFDSCTRGGIMKMKRPSLTTTCNTKTKTQECDPLMAEFVRKECAIARVESLTQKGPPAGTFANFKKDLKQRFEEPEHARMVLLAFTLLDERLS